MKALQAAVQMICRGLSRAVLVIGMGIIALLAVPAVILFLIICGIWTLIGWFTSVIEGKDRK